MKRTVFALVALFFTFIATAAPAQNVGQVDGTVGPGECPTGGVVHDVPGLTLSLDTTGNPVLMNYTVQFNGNPTAGITLWPVIDGVTQTGAQREPRRPSPARSSRRIREAGARPGARGPAVTCPVAALRRAGCAS